MVNLWISAALVRALKTGAQSAVAMLTVDYTTNLLEINWLGVLSVTSLAMLISLLTSIAGIPEVNTQLQGGANDQSKP